MSISETRVDYIGAFNPKEYLNECYAEPDAEYRFAVQLMITALRNVPQGLPALEFGGGPTLYSAAVLAPRVREIHFCDYVEANLEEVQHWLDNDPNAFNWDPYIRVILEEEGNPVTLQAVTRRKSEMRRKITRLMGCNALNSNPLGQNVCQYDLVTAPYCTDVAAASVSEWVQVIRNISTLVAPGGWLLIGVTTGANTNTVGQKSFPCVDLTDQEIYQGYMATGYNPNTFRLDKRVLPDGREYSGLTSAIARKGQ